MRVYIHRPDRTAFSLNRQAALVGFSLRGDDVELFDADEFDALSLTPADIVVGGVGYVHRALKRLGLAVPELANIPACLLDFAGRKIWTARLGDVRRAVERGEAIFMKPLPRQLKLFTGQLLREVADLVATAYLPDETVVECSEPVAFVSEHRVFVLHGQIVGVRQYAGDPLVFPDAGSVRAAVATFEDAPASYALDVGVCDDGRTLLVEVNDGYAIGAYGLAPITYAAMIDARWAGLRQNNKGQRSDAGPAE